MRHEFLPEARIEFDDAADWYELRSPGLGSAFILKVRSVVYRLLEHPESSRVIFDDFRRAPVRGFPYAVVYRIEGDLLVIHAVWQAEQDPAKLRDRLAPGEDE